MKKILSVSLCAAVVSAFALPAFAIELSPNASSIPSVFAKATGGKVIYDRASTAYCSNTFNKILEGYGLKISSENVANVPATYAKTSDSNISFNNNSTAYETAGYHSIFTAYGLQLSPEEVSAKLGSVNYAKTVNGKIVFGKGSTAYSGDELAIILSAYNLPPAPMASTPVSPPPFAPAVSSPPIDTDKDGISDAKDKCPGTPLGANIDERGCWVLSAAYLFDFDKSTIKPQYFSFLDDVIKVLSDNPALNVEIQGHTDSVGSNSYNQGLSERRAKAVKSYLTEKGVNPSRLSQIGFGEERPADTNETSEGQAKNRRVELKPIW